MNVERGMGEEEEEDKNDIADSNDDDARGEGRGGRGVVRVRPGAQGADDIEDSQMRQHHLDSSHEVFSKIESQRGAEEQPKFKDEKMTSLKAESSSYFYHLQ